MEGAISSSPAALALVDGENKLHVASPSLGHLVGEAWQDLIGQDFLELFCPEERSLMAARLAEPPDPKFFFPTRIEHRGGGNRELDARCYRLDIPDETWTVVILLDVTSERRLLRKLSGISLVASSLTYAGGLRATLDSLSQRVVETTDAVAASVIILEEQGESFRFVMGGSHGLPTENMELMEEGLACHQLALERGFELPAVTARRTRQTAVVCDMRAQIAQMDLQHMPEPLRKLCGLALVQTWNAIVAVPIELAGQFLGTLNCYYAISSPEPAELSFLRTLADLAAVALQNARLMEEFEKQTILQERRRLARELHDSVSQALYGIALGVKSAQANLGFVDSPTSARPDKAREALDYVLELAEGAGKEMRALLYSLRPETLEEEGLVAALQRQAEALRARYGIEVDFEADGEPHLGPARRLALFRVAGESLHNVVKHSRAQQVRLRLTNSSDHCQLEVVDNGTGFDPAHSKVESYGLDSMRERVEGAGGRWELHSGIGQGTTIRATLPLLQAQNFHFRSHAQISADKELAG